MRNTITERPTAKTPVARRMRKTRGCLGPSLLSRKSRPSRYASFLKTSPSGTSEKCLLQRKRNGAEPKNLDRHSDLVLPKTKVYLRRFITAGCPWHPLHNWAMGCLEQIQQDQHYESARRRWGRLLLWPEHESNSTTATKSVAEYAGKLKEKPEGVIEIFPTALICWRLASL
jgi:hypothetical protein